MGGVDGLGHGLDDLDLLFEAKLRQQGLQGLALDELHGDVALALPLAHLVHAADVRVLDPGLVLGFHDEPRHQFGLVAPEELEGHHPLQAGIEGLEYAPHAAFGQEAEVAVLLPGRQREHPQDLPPAAIAERARRGQAVPGVPAFQARIGGDRRPIPGARGGGQGSLAGGELERGFVQAAVEGGEVFRIQAAAALQGCDRIRLLGHLPDRIHVQQPLDQPQAEQTLLALSVHASTPTVRPGLRRV